MCLGIRSGAIDPVSTCYTTSLRVMCHKTAQDRHHLLDICKEYKKRSSTGKGDGEGKRKRQGKTDDNKRQKSHVHGAVNGDRTIDGNNDGNATEDEVEDANAPGLGMNFDFELDEQDAQQVEWFGGLSEAMGLGQLGEHDADE